MNPRMEQERTLATRGGRLGRLAAAVAFVAALAVSGLGAALAQETVPQPPAAEMPAAEAPPATGAPVQAGPPPLPAEGPPELPPPLPVEPQIQVYVAENGQQVGPLTADELRARIADGRVQRSTLAWMAGMAAWAPASSVPELAGLFPAIDNSTYLVGTWQMQGAVPIPGHGNATAQGTLTYAEGGTLSGYGSMQMPAGAAGPGTPAMTVQLNFSGTWSAQPVGDSQITVNSTMTTTMSIPGMAPVSETATSTETVVIIDRNNAIVQPGETRMVRVGG